MQFFNELGELIAQRWRDRNYDEAVFPELAAAALAEMSPAQQVSPWEIVRWLCATTHLPSQQDISGRFGDPPLTLYAGSRFYIDVYFWLDGTTSIHQHSFCGAFQVLLGSSIHSRYSFARQQQINEHFIAGEMLLQSVELLAQGEIKQILPGQQYIHSLFHLDRPSATICVRTYLTSSGAPQYDYHKPYFAIDPFFKEPLAVKQLQSAALLLNIQHPEAVTMIGQLLARADFQTTYGLLNLARDHFHGNSLEKAFGVTTGEQQFQSLLALARRRHGQLIDLIQPVQEEKRRQHNLMRRRGQITSHEHRFFLALLLNVPSREKVLAMVQQRYPAQDPIETVTDWLEELAHTKVWGSSEPNVLGIDALDDDYLFVFQCLLRGYSLAQTIRVFEEEFLSECGEEQRNKLAALYTAIIDSMLFKSIFSDLTSSAYRAMAAV